MNSCENDRKPAHWTTFCAIALSCFALLLSVSAAQAAGGGPGRGSSYMVTITNLTYDQIISPPVVVVHDDRFSLFHPGQPAGSELVALAEDGMTGPLAGLLAVSTGVGDYAVAAGGIPPGGSITVEVSVRGRAKLFSVAGMLVSSNDAFIGLNGYALPFGLFNSSGSMGVNAPAYDAGSEANTESCDHIPGPPCGNPGERMTDGAEGFVHIHRGIHGTGDLDASMKDWRNPAAWISIKRK